LVLKELTEVGAEMDFPDKSEIIALGELADSLKLQEGLTNRLCTEQFTALQAYKSFNIAFDALRRQQTLTSDKILTALKNRYEQRKNPVLLSALSFLSDPKEYDTSNKGILELSELGVEMRALCARLFPDPMPGTKVWGHSTLSIQVQATLRSPGCPALLETILRMPCRLVLSRLS